MVGEDIVRCYRARHWAAATEHGRDALDLVLDLAKNHGCFQHLDDHVQPQAGMELQVWADYHKTAVFEH